MACCNDSRSGSRGQGSCGCGPQPFPWLGALCDPAIRRMFFRRYRRDLALGAAAGCLAALPALGLGDRLGALGPALGGPWLRLHPAAVLAAAVPGGIALALALAWKGARGWAAGSGWVLAWALLAGAANGCLDLGEASLDGFIRNGGLSSALAFAILGLPAVLLAWGLLAAVFRQPKYAATTRASRSSSAGVPSTATEPRSST